jgi:hypothetical protein
MTAMTCAVSVPSPAILSIRIVSVAITVSANCTALCLVAKAPARDEAAGS